jgi:hypothetical protein
LDFAIDGEDGEGLNSSEVDFGLIIVGDDFASAFSPKVARLGDVCEPVLYSLELDLASGIFGRGFLGFFAASSLSTGTALFIVLVPLLSTNVPLKVLVPLLSTIVPVIVLLNVLLLLLSTNVPEFIVLLAAFLSTKVPVLSVLFVTKVPLFIVLFNVLLLLLSTKVLEAIVPAVLLSTKVLVESLKYIML